VWWILLGEHVVHPEYEQDSFRNRNDILDCDVLDLGKTCSAGLETSSPETAKCGFEGEVVV
jgi:hypothetical protein